MFFFPQQQGYNQILLTESSVVLNPLYFNMGNKETKYLSKRIYFLLFTLRFIIRQNNYSN